MGKSMRRLRDPVAGRLGEQMMEHSRDIRGMLVMHAFQIQLRNILNLLWQITQEFIVICSSEKFCEQYND